MAFVLPFAVVQGVNGVWLKYGEAKSDSPEGLMALGRNWLEWSPLRVFHMPGYLWAEVSAVILSVSPDHFQLAGILVGFSFVIIMGVYLALLDLTASTILLLSVLAAFFPTTLALSRTWNEYYIFCVLAPVVAVLFYQRKPAAYVWIGVMAANLFTVLPLCGVVLIARDRARAVMYLALGFMIGANAMLAYWGASFVDALTGQSASLVQSWMRIPDVGEFGISPERYVAIPAIVVVCYLALHLRSADVRAALLAFSLVAALVSTVMYVRDQREFLKAYQAPDAHNADHYRTGVIR